MTIRPGWGRISRLLVWAFLSLIILLLVLEARQWLFRAQAEALLEDIKSLELNRSNWSDAQKIMKRWGKWGGWYERCDAGDCSYSIRIRHLSLVDPEFVLLEGPHIGARALEVVGLRSAEVYAQIHVVHGVITNKGFGLEVALPVSRWITPGGRFWLKPEIGSTYWPSLDAAFFEAAKLRNYSPYTFAGHPNRSFIQRRIRLEASFTPEESAEEQVALTDFRFDCITRWTPCISRAELLPKAEEEFESQQTDLHPPCKSIVEFRAREEQDVMLGEIVSVSSSPKDSQGSPTILVRLEKVLKGGAPVENGGVFRTFVPHYRGEQRTLQPMVSAKVLLMGMRNAEKSADDLDFSFPECGIVEASQENISAVQKGVREDFGPRY